MTQQYDIYGIGAALVDTEITLTDDDLLTMQVEKGVMTLVDQERQNFLIEKLETHGFAYRRASGGSAANTVIAASYFGCKNFYSCKVANDDNGRFYLHDMQAAGVDTPRHTTLEHGITGKCLVMITPDTERTMNTFLGISASLSEQELDLDAVAQSRYAYIEGYLVTSPTGRAAAIKLRQHAEQHGVKTVISLSDPAMAQFFRDGLLEMIGQHVHLIFCNHEEATAFTQTDNLDLACEQLKTYCDAFAITCGAQGAIVWNGQTLTKIAAPKVKAIDSNGAGDMFAGAFLYAVSQGHAYVKAGEFAVLAAAKVVTQYGPRLRAEQHGEVKAGFWESTV